MAIPRMRLIDQLLMEKSQRVGKKITQIGAARLLGLNPAFFNHLITGITSGSRNEGRLKKVAKFFDLTTEELLQKIQEEKEANLE